MHGKGVKIALSRLAMEVVLSPCVVFFWEAHERIGDRHLDGYFGQFGQIYRAAQVSVTKSISERILTLTNLLLRHRVWFHVPVNPNPSAFVPCSVRYKLNF